jgi:molybdenum cofactor biosynthesis enzyme MoaA
MFQKASGDLQMVAPAISNSAHSLDPQNTVAGWSFSAEDLRAALDGKILLNPSIDLSNACNLNCAYCFIEEKNSSRKVRRPTELTIEEITEVLGDFATAGTRTVNIVGAGEPTIDPYFKQVITAIAELGLTPFLFTNGIRLATDVGLVDFLYSAGATVVLKYNSIDHSLQDLVAGQPGYSDQRDRALASLLSRGFASSTPTRLALDVIAFQGNYFELSAIHRLCRTRNIHPLIADFIPTGRTEGGAFVGQASSQNLDIHSQKRIASVLRPLENHQRLGLFQELKTIDASEFGIHRLGRHAYYSGGACTQSLGLYVDIQGNIWPCVARSRIVDGKLTSGWLGNTRLGTKPSVLWKTDPYLQEVRAAFTGACDYKPVLSPPAQFVPVTSLSRQA